MQDLRTLVQSQDIHIVLLGETNSGPQQPGCPTFCVPPGRGIAPRDRFRGTAHPYLSRRHPTPCTRSGRLEFSPAGRQLLQDSEQYGYEVIGTDTPSHIPTDPRFRADVLDVVLCHQLPYPIYVEVLYDIDTQHLPILITLGTTAHMTPARPSTHRTDWSAFKSTLEELHIGKSFSCPEEVDTAAQRLTEKVQAAYSAAITRLPARTSRRWDLPPHLKLALQKKCNLQKLWARTRCPRIKRELNHIKQVLRQALWTFRGAAWEETIEQAGEDWKPLHLLCRRLTRSPAPECPLFDKTGTRRYAAKDRAEILAEHLEEQFTPHTPSDRGSIAIRAGGTPRGRIPDGPGAALAGDDQAIQRHTPDRTLSEELEHGLCHCHTEGRQGPPTRNELTTNHAPVPHCQAVRVYCAATPSSPSDSKTGAVWVSQRALHYAPAGKSPPPHGRLSTTGVVVPSVFLDIDKAFDRVWHPGLMFKLLNTQIPPALVRTVASFLEGRSFFVAVEDATSDPRPIHAGVSQGSCLSPCLYGVYTDDIPTLTDQLQDWEEDVVLALYADDSAYFASSRRADLAAAKIQMAEQMACRRKRYEDGYPSDRPAAYHATETKTLGTRC
ncbi:RNA-directed DNA polymerase from mobile element jockey [Eumeta japonica]|uniref:RNA-directed DNA polymerase from mobile element jockey n=1 Tax=Eumeta variegata TaxID=151549 RepID=A0A4C1ZS12_EUMVA|nr:RNA-directed DNA polymerase from mobile element jockey [Eumeta japonica]